MRTATPFARPIYIMAKPAGASCNLACKYCYYLEKHHLYKDTPQQLMSNGLLEKFISEYMQSVTTPEILFTWHGGETLIRHCPRTPCGELHPDKRHPAQRQMV